MIEKVHWVGPIQDSSGYANATRNYILSILKAGKLELTAEAVSFEKQHVEHQSWQIIQPYCRSIDSDTFVQVIHLTPENYSRFYRPGKYNIGYTTWETDSIPPSWINSLNSMQEIWVPSAWNIEVFKKCGVTSPVIRIPHAIPVPDLDQISMPNYPGDNLSNYWFYSIFQWTSRKNFFATLCAYYTEFKDQEDIILALKTYRMSSSPREVQLIKQEISHIKNSLNLSSYPAVLLFSELLDDAKMLSLHKRGNCFVLPSRAEGFGIPFAEAMALGKPVIGSNYGGLKDFIQHEHNGLLINCREQPVYGMTWMKHYNASMTWGDPDIMHLRKLMRWAYENQDAAKKLGEQARQDIKDNFSYLQIGNLITNRIEEILRIHGRL